MRENSRLSPGPDPDGLQERLSRRVRARPSRLHLSDVAIGVGAALAAVALRYALPLSPMQLPVLTVIVALALVTTFVGIVAGIVTAIVGGLLSWYVFFDPFSFDLNQDGAILLTGFSVTATVIITTSQLYRLSERRHHQAEVAALEEEAATADLFARELAHRLKNALAIIQSIAFQTLDPEREETEKFGARLRALANAHDLLSTHVDTPTASVCDVVHAALEPFSAGGDRVQVECPEIRIVGQQAVTLALGLHELGTNAVKHGALSVPEGRVSVLVEDTGEQIKLGWKEGGGPPVAAPAKGGFGSRLLNRIGMGTQILFEPDGVRAWMYLRKD